VSPSYLDLSREGAGSGVRYLLGLVTILLSWLILGSLLGAGLGAALGGSVGWRSLVVDLGPFVLLLGGVLLAVRHVLQRPARTVVTARPRVSVRRVLVGAGVWAGLTAVVTGVDAALHPDAYSLTFAAASFIPLAVVALLLVPMQAASEELLFRGYLMQWTSLAGPTGRTLLQVAALAAVNGLLFGVPHLLNAEAQGAQAYAWLYWFFLGAGWAWASVLDGRIELAIGAHIANNLFAILVVSYTGSSIASTGIWSTSVLDLPLSIAAAGVISVLFVLITCRGLRPRSGTS